MTDELGQGFAYFCGPVGYVETVHEFLELDDLGFAIGRISNIGLDKGMGGKLAKIATLPTTIFLILQIEYLKTCHKF